MSKINKTSKYSKEFKVEAIRLAKESGSTSKTAKDLGITDLKVGALRRLW